MKGVNSIKLNQETMCQAVQVWLDKTLASGHGQKVTQVKVADTARNAYATTDEFDVQVTAQPEGVA